MPQRVGVDGAGRTAPHVGRGQHRRLGQHHGDTGARRMILGIADREAGHVGQAVARPGADHAGTPRSCSVARAITLAEATRSSIATNSSGWCARSRMPGP